MNKLTLRRETVRLLTDIALEGVAGGSCATYGETSCANTGPGSCNGCTQYCWAPTEAPGGCGSRHRLPE